MRSQAECPLNIWSKNHFWTVSRGGLYVASNSDVHTICIRKARVAEGSRDGVVDTLRPGIPVFEAVTDFSLFTTAISTVNHSATGVAVMGMVSGSSKVAVYDCQ